MESVKKLWESKTFWGVVSTVANPIAKFFGYDLGDFNTWIPDILLFGGAALAIYGRIKAVKRIK